jgi:hypothetical protein
MAVSNMSITIAAVRKRLYDAIPDGTTKPWPDLLEAAGAERPLVQSLAFGKPESISRTGDDFVCRGKVAAEMPARFGFRASSEKVVRFTLESVSDSKLNVKNISGVKVKPPVGFSFAITQATITMDSRGHLFLSSGKFGMKLTVELDNSGKFIDWRFGN